MWEDIGLDVDSMSPEAQVATGAIMVAAVAGGIGLVLFLVPWLWWLVFVFGWAIFPAFSLFIKGVAGVVDSDDGKIGTSGSSKERQLLEALSRRGEMTPAQASMETSLTVKEADEMMKELASGGHLDVRVRGAAIFYSLWGDDGVEKREESGEM